MEKTKKSKEQAEAEAAPKVEDHRIQFYTGADSREVYVVRNDPEFANKMLAKTALLRSF